MNDTALQPKPKWPVVIAIISFLYVTFRCLLFRPSLNSTLISIVLGYAIIASMFCGAFGLAYRRSWGRKVLVLGSWLAISQGAHSLITVISFIGGIPPIFTMLGMLTLMIALCGWPVFLLFWFRRHRLTDYISTLDLKNNYMNGIRVKGKTKLDKYPDDPKVWALDFEFYDLFKIIEPFVSHFYWAIDSDICWKPITSMEQKEQDIFLNYLDTFKRVKGFLCVKPGVFDKVSKYVVSDYAHIYGFLTWESCLNFVEKEVKSRKEFCTRVITHTQIYMTCTDGMYWDVYSKELSLLNLIKKSFKHTELCILK